MSAGLSTRDIAKKENKSQTTIRYWLKKYGLSSKLSIFNTGGCGKRKICFCKECGETDPEKFYIGGSKRIKCRCRSCHNQIQIDRFRDYKRQAVEYKGGKCSICGYNKCLAALEFHHNDPSQKDINWRKMRNWVFEKIKEELDKCDLVCANCHREIHQAKS